MPKSDRKDKVERFVEEYLLHLNATKAYKASHPGCTDGTARTEGSRLLANPDIQEKISAAKRERSRRTAISQDKVLRELARIAFLDPREAFDSQGDLIAPQSLSGNLARAVKAVEVNVMTVAGQPIGTTKKIKFESKVRALEILLEHVKTENEKASDSQPTSFLDLVKKAQAAREKK